MFWAMGGRSTSLRSASLLGSGQMATPAEALFFFVLVVVFLVLPLGLMAILFALSRKYRGMFDEIGFTRKEMGLLIVGSLAAQLYGLLLGASGVPLFAFGNYFLAIDVGGALIPTVLSIHLIRAKRIPAVVWAPAVLAVSLVTFLITRVQPSMGIVASFPYMFLPALSAAVISLALYSRDNPRTPALAYATATLGSLIGADVFHLPELFEAREFVGSIGGAGVFDLVYVGGIVSLAMVLLFAGSRLRGLRARMPHAELSKERVQSELRRAVVANMMGAYQQAAQRALGAVQERTAQLGRAYAVTGTYPAILERLVPDPNVLQSYTAVARAANTGGLDFATAHWSVLQAQALLQRLQGEERKRYASVARRLVAFLVDGLVMAALMALLAGLLFAAGPRLAQLELLSIAVILWGFTIQVLYFSLFEYFWNGQTPGKRLLRIRVYDLNGDRAGFITAFTRNTVRLLDFLLFGYAVSLLLIGLTERAQRIGDRVAETVVIHERPASASISAAQTGPSSAGP